MLVKQSCPSVFGGDGDGKPSWDLQEAENTLLPQKHSFLYMLIPLEEAFLMGFRPWDFPMSILK